MWIADLQQNEGFGVPNKRFPCILMTGMPEPQSHNHNPVTKLPIALILDMIATELCEFLKSKSLSLFGLKRIGNLYTCKHMFQPCTIFRCIICEKLPRLVCAIGNTHGFITPFLSTGLLWAAGKQRFVLNEDMMTAMGLPTCPAHAAVLGTAFPMYSYTPRPNVMRGMVGNGMQMNVVARQHNETTPTHPRCIL